METVEFSVSILRASSTVPDMCHRAKLGARICNLLENKNLAHSAHVKKSTNKNIPPRGMS